MTVNVNADFAAASKNKNLCCLLITDLTSVVDVNENGHSLPADDMHFFVSVMKFMMNATVLLGKC